MDNRQALGSPLSEGEWGYALLGKLGFPLYAGWNALITVCHCPHSPRFAAATSLSRVGLGWRGALFIG